MLSAFIAGYCLGKHRGALAFQRQLLASRSGLLHALALTIGAGARHRSIWSGYDHD